MIWVMDSLMGNLAQVISSAISSLHESKCFIFRPKWPDGWKHHDLIAFLYFGVSIEWNLGYYPPKGAGWLSVLLAANNIYLAGAARGTCSNRGSSFLPRRWWTTRRSTSYLTSSWWWAWQPSAPTGSRGVSVRTPWTPSASLAGRTSCWRGSRWPCFCAPCSSPPWLSATRCRVTWRSLSRCVRVCVRCVRVRVYACLLWWRAQSSVGRGEEDGVVLEKVRWEQEMDHSPLCGTPTDFIHRQ